MDNYLWFMVFCLTMNGVASMKIFEGMRLLVTMIVQCIIGMIPFLTLFLTTVLMFAVINHSTVPKKERTLDKFKDALGNQYMALFGENFESEDLVQWTMWILFT